MTPLPPVSNTSAVVPVDGELQEEIRPYWDIDWLRVELVADHVYVMELRARALAWEP